MSEQCGCAALILAAGEGTRMKSSLAKVLHAVAGKSMIRHVLETVQAVSPSRIVIVIGHQAEAVRRELDGERVEFVIQEPRLGTGHAALMAEWSFGGFAGRIVVLNGDTPLLRPRTLESLVAFHRGESASATVLSAEIDDPAGYGRIVRDGRGAFLRITEHKDANDSVRAIREINSGIFCFESVDLFGALKKVGRRNVQGEYYITDVMEILRGAGKRVVVYRCDQREEVLGINTVEQLQAAERLMKKDG
ncbi:MAG: NTP transferase domain-containing protein [Candidatus Krumholzibacteria bacterium]|nr:NTP transferase domain-containing protein [Candidatus Krumholzibacteria bacterium]